MKFIGNCSNQINWLDIIAELDSIESQSTDICDPRNLDPKKSVDENEKLAVDILQENQAKYFAEMLPIKGKAYCDKLSTPTSSILYSWKHAGYKISNITWEDFYSHDYPIVRVLAEQFSQIFNAIPIYEKNVITRLRAGRIAPWHYDTLPDISDYKSKGELVRYVCFINDSTPGQTLTVGNTTVAHASVGDIYQWDSNYDWHAAANASMKHFYMFHFEGYR